MNVRIVNLKKGLAIASLLLLSSIANAQVMWNLKGGWMSRDVQMSESGSMSDIEKKTRPDWMVGMELEIPLSEKLNLETGLRYKNHYVLVNNVYDYGSFQEEGWDEAKTIFELPLRLTYKQKLGKHFSLHAGVGPYVSAIADGWESKAWRETKWNDFVHVGLEPSVAINWACFSLGASYNIPCFYKGYKDKNDPVVMATLGIRFKSSAWRYVGATLLTIATVGGAAANAWSSAVEANQGYSSGSDGLSSYSGVKSSSSKNTNQKVSHANWTALENSYSGDESLLIKMRSSGNYDKNEVRTIQKRMAETRKKIKQQSGHDRQASPLETWVP